MTVSLELAHSLGCSLISVMLEAYIVMTEDASVLLYTGMSLQ